MSEPVTLSYEFTRDDAVAWWANRIRASTVARRSRIRQTLQWSAVYLGFATVLVFFFRNATSAIVLYPIAAFLAVLTWTNYTHLVDTHLQEQAADPKAQGAYGQVTLTLSDQGLREVTPATDSFVKWSSVTSVIRSQDRLFLPLTTGQAAVIPRRSYSGPIPFDNLPEFIERLRVKSLTSPSSPL